MWTIEGDLRTVPPFPVGIPLWDAGKPADPGLPVSRLWQEYLADHLRINPATVRQRLMRLGHGLEVKQLTDDVVLVATRMIRAGTLITFVEGTVVETALTKRPPARKAARTNEPFFLSESTQLQPWSMYATEDRHFPRQATEKFLAKDLRAHLENRGAGGLIAISLNRMPLSPLHPFSPDANVVFVQFPDNDCAEDTLMVAVAFTDIKPGVALVCASREVDSTTARTTKGISKPLSLGRRVKGARAQSINGVDRVVFRVTSAQLSGRARTQTRWEAFTRAQGGQISKRLLDFMSAMAELYAPNAAAFLRLLQTYVRLTWSTYWSKFESRVKRTDHAQVSYLLALAVLAGRIVDTRVDQGQLDAVLGNNAVLAEVARMSELMTEQLLAA